MTCSGLAGAAAVRQPGLETVVGSQQLTATYDPLREHAWKVTHIYQQMPEQLGGGCSGI